MEERDEYPEQCPLCEDELSTPEWLMGYCPECGSFIDEKTHEVAPEAFWAQCKRVGYP